MIIKVFQQQSFVRYLFKQDSQQKIKKMHNLQPSEQQANRLKQILFPRRNKTQINSTSSSQVSETKENQYREINMSHGVNAGDNIRKQILKLKESIQNFMQKQNNVSNDNLLKTPRECLELIKYMSQGMVNYQTQIQQAVTTLLESVPKPKIRGVSNSKYFVMMLKFSYLSSLYNLRRKTIISESFTQIKLFSEVVSCRAQQMKERSEIQNNKLFNLIFKKLYKTFARWRLNAIGCQKNQIENYYKEMSIDRTLNQVNILSDESKMVLYLQTLLQTNADHLQILLVNSNKTILRGYKIESQILNPHFESVHNQSSGSIDLNQNIESYSALQFLQKQKIKRIELPLQHSLTKICIIKKQTLIIQDIRKDPDYFQGVDDYTVFVGLSARENVKTCVFVPIFTKKNACIGIIRMYYYGNRTGQSPSSQSVSMLAQTLQNCVKTATIFEQIKRKYTSIKNGEYLKAIKFLNQVERQERICMQQQNQLYELLQSYFNIKMLGKYNYSSTTSQALNKTSNITVTSSKYQLKVPTTKSQSDLRMNIGGKIYGVDQDIENLSNMVMIIKKMKDNDLYYLYENNLLYLCLNHQFFIFARNKNEGQFKADFHQEKQHTNQQARESVKMSIPVELLKQVILKMEQEKHKKQRVYQQFKMQRQLKEKIEKQKILMQKKSRILDFCLKCPKVETQSQLVKIISQYLVDFCQTETYQSNSSKIQIKHKSRNELSNNSEIIKPLSQNKCILFENQDVQIILKGKLPSNNEDGLNVDTLLSPLKQLCENVTSQLVLPVACPKFKDMDIKAELYYIKGSIQQGFKDLISHLLRLNDGQLKIIQVQGNPFTTNAYHIYTEASNFTINSSEALIRVLRNSSTAKFSCFTKKMTLLCLQIEGSLITIMLNMYLKIEDQQLYRLLQVYKKWVSWQRSCRQFESQKETTERILRSGIKIDNLLRQRLRFGFFTLRKAVFVVKNINLQLLSRLINRCDRVSLGFAFSMMKQNLKLVPTISALKQQCKITELILCINKLSKMQILFKIHKKSKETEKKIQMVCNIVRRHENFNLFVCFQQIYNYSQLPKLNKFYTLTSIIKWRLSSVFQQIRRYSHEKDKLSIISDQTQCGVISKLDNLTKISQIISDKFNHFHVMLRTNDGKYFRLTKGSVLVFDEFIGNPGHQFVQFAVQSTKSHVRNVIWMIPETDCISLIEKHFLQVLSRAIQQGFQKYLRKNTQIITFLNIFSSLKSRKLVKDSFKKLKSFLIQRIKGQSYELRDKFYQLSVEVQNYRLMELQQKREEQKRMEEIADNINIRDKLELQLNDLRKTNVRLEVTSRKFEQIQNEQRVNREKDNKLRLFNMWRIEAAFRTKYAQRRSLARRKQNLIYRTIFKILALKSKQALNFGFKRIALQSANIRAQSLSQCKKQVIITPNTNNRLLTFQDELNEEYQNEKIRIVSKQNQRDENCQRADKQLSIIPISFKHFEVSQGNKQNYDLTDEEARKVNGGAYKLNTKTLKFLKRMGKLNNN